MPRQTHDPAYICGVTGNAGLTAFTEAIGSGSLRDGIRVNGVSPGPTATDRLVGLASKRAQDQFGDPARWAELFKSLPGGRVGQPAEIAAMVAFLASPHVQLHQRRRHHARRRRVFAHGVIDRFVCLSLWLRSQRCRM